MGFWIHTLWHWVTSRSAETWSAIATCVNAVTVILLARYTIKATRSAEGSLAEARGQSALARAQYGLAFKEQQDRQEAAFYKATFEFQNIQERVRRLRDAIQDNGVLPMESPMGNEWHNVMVVMGQTLPSAREALLNLGQTLWSVEQHLEAYHPEYDSFMAAKDAVESLTGPVEDAWGLLQEISEKMNEHVESKRRSDVATTTAPPL